MRGGKGGHKDYLSIFSIKLEWRVQILRHLLITRNHRAASKLLSSKKFITLKRSHFVHCKTLKTPLTHTHMTTYVPSLFLEAFQDGIDVVEGFINLIPHFRTC